MQGGQRGGPGAASLGAWSSPEDAFPAPGSAPGLGCLLRYSCFLQRAVVTLAGVPCGQPMYLLRASVSPSLLQCCLGPPMGAARVCAVSPITSLPRNRSSGERGVRSGS